MAQGRPYHRGPYVNSFSKHGTTSLAPLLGLSLGLYTILSHCVKDSPSEDTNISYEVWNLPLVKDIPTMTLAVKDAECKTEGLYGGGLYWRDIDTTTGIRGPCLTDPSILSRKEVLQDLKDIEILHSSNAPHKSQDQI